LSVVVVLGLVMSATAQQNIMLIVADDVGVDLIGAYDEHPVPGRTPVIDQLASSGMLFRNAWSNPVCSPTRTTMLTGRYSFRTGIGYAIQYVSANIELYPGEVTLPDILSPVYHTAALGKWHLATKAVSGLAHPNLAGFEEYRGNITVYPVQPDLTGDGYFSFEKTIDGQTEPSTTYSSTDIVDDALDVISSTEEPWFLWLAFNAPHIPFHKPPPALHTYDLPLSVADSGQLHGRAMLEAMDTELGRLFAEMDPAVLAETLIIVVGDNGTSKYVVTPPWDPTKAKETVYEGGVNVPLIVAGPGVKPGTECRALVNLTDLFATIAEVAGVPATTGVDSVSMVPYFAEPDTPSQRSWVYSEMAKTQLSSPPFNGYGPFAKWDRVVRGARFKLMRNHNGSWVSYQEQLFDLETDPFETVNLLGGRLDPLQEQAYARLKTVMTGLIPRWLDAGHALAGTLGTPRLIGSGNPAPGGLVTLRLTRAKPESTTTLVAGLGSATQPAAGGVLVPAPDVLITGLTIDADGMVAVDVELPAMLPSGSRVYFQHRVVDPKAPQGVAFSNALIATLAP
jgi:arylsulfatase A-like enzyme